MFNETLANIIPVKREKIDLAYNRLNSLTKPKGSLGRLEDIAARCAAILGIEKPSVTRKKFFVFAADHGVVEEGVSAYPAEVTELMVINMLNEGAAINVLAKRVGAELELIDIGMGSDPVEAKFFIKRKVRAGTKNFATGPAMTSDEALAAISVGIERAKKAVDSGFTMLGTGEMGIGNTSAASALITAYQGIPIEQTVGPGTGLDSAGLQNKINVLKRALAINADKCTDPLSTLAALGGLEIAGICGLCLGAAANKCIVVVDGFTSSAGALAAIRMCPDVKDYLFFSHMSAEPGHRFFFDSLGLIPILNLGMRLGEGTGAAIAMQIIEDAIAVYNEMATFEDAGIIPGA
ncbi:MAG: nicotinate-nucleotide--dimethylbenzimidazole phosphoribosyltransferase [Lentisphaerae bacterium]|nr:nicotinate-nucleotide--dimethylbenzimidazole phosphoribosyltransferase [Lentisphaerota bacterium]